MKRLKVAVIGFGVMGKYHANVYAALPHTDLVAVVDPDPLRCVEAETAYAVRSFGRSCAMLDTLRPDAVSIAAPTSMHFELTKRFLDEGVHVLVEKPVATDVAQAQRLAQLSRRRGLVLQVGHITRFYRSVQILRERIREPYLIEARRLTPNARIKDVGAILDLMIHDIDILLSLVQSDIQEATVAGQILNGSLFEDVAAAQIVFENGCIARLLASRVAPDAERSLVVAEPKQTLRLDFGKDPYAEIAVYRPVGDSSSGNHVQVDRIEVREDNPLRTELEHFTARIRGQEPPIGTLEDDLRSLQLATRLIAQLKAKRRVELSY